MGIIRLIVMKLKPIIPYIVPYLVFILFSYMSPYAEQLGYFIYPVKTVVTATLLFYWAKSYTEIHLSFSIVSVIVGIFAFLLWIGLTEYMPFNYFHPPSEGYNPIKESGALTIFVVIFRLGGAVLVVPVFEELFIRSFAIRFFINTDDFKSVRVGTFTWFSCIASVVIFAAGHKMWEWPAALAVGILYTLLLYRRKEIIDCIIAHAVTNLCLGIYVLSTQKWGYW